MQYKMNLNPRALEMIRVGTKTIEVRLFDKKRSQIKISDEIEFASTSDSTQKVLAKVTKLHQYPTFTELYNSLSPEMFGGKNTEELIKNIYTYYKPEDEKKFGVIGLELQYIK